MDAATAGAICPHGQSCAIARTSPLDSCQDDSPQSSYIEKSGEIARVVRGVYYVPEKSRFLDTEVPASVDEVVRAIARANKWVVAPAGDAALNALGLDTQVSARYVYVSSGPYKTYAYGPYEIELKHRANRDLLDCSPVTCTIVQALKALGKDGVGNDTIALLARNLSEEDIETFRKESKGLTSWVAETGKKIWEERNNG